MVCRVKPGMNSPAGAHIDQNWIGLGQPLECKLVGLNAPVRGKLHPSTPLNPNWSIN